MPVVRLLNSILHRAIRDRARATCTSRSSRSVFRIRYRVDGALYEVEAPPPHLAVPLVSRIKVMADLDITEARVPQDGRIELSIDGRPVDLRVATLPGASGEGCVMRILDRSAVSLDLKALGLQPGDEAALRAMTRLPHGIVLVTGPTGSGKTTTLYAMLSEANTPETKIITVEDPVEYDIAGIVQVPIHDDIGVTYASVLRSILRQDPDKILVGEIRDRETGATAVEASLTGHTVFATIHTNDAPSTVTRLVDMGVEPFLVAATLESVVAQRLVRSVCPDCKVTYEPDDELLMDLGPDADLVRGTTLSYGKRLRRLPPHRLPRAHRTLRDHGRGRRGPAPDRGGGVHRGGPRGGRGRRNGNPARGGPAGRRGGTDDDRGGPARDAGLIHGEENQTKRARAREARRRRRWRGDRGAPGAEARRPRQQRHWSPTSPSSSRRCPRRGSRWSRRSRILEGQTEPGPFKNVLAEITDDVSAGAPLSEAMGKHDRAFDPLYASMVRAGEAGGILDRVLDRLASSARRRPTIRAKIKQAMLYPSALILFAIAAVVGVIVFVIPRFREIFDSYGVDLPRPTQILLALSDAGSKYWYLVIGIPIADPPGRTRSPRGGAAGTAAGGTGSSSRSR